MRTEERMYEDFTNALGQVVFDIGAFLTGTSDEDINELLIGMLDDLETMHRCFRDMNIRAKINEKN